MNKAPLHINIGPPAMNNALLHINIEPPAMNTLLHMKIWTVCDELRTVMHKYRAASNGQCTVTLEYRATMHEYRAIMHEYRAIMHEYRDITHKFGPPSMDKARSQGI